MKKAFIERRFSRDVAAIIENINVIVAEHAAMGLTLTVRQLYYQFIGRNLFPDSWMDRAYNLKNKLDPDTKNTLKNYKRLANIANDGRLAGWIDWNAIEDRSRWLRDRNAFDDPLELIEQNPGWYRESLWALSQEKYCEVWIEKDALVGVIEQPCHELRVPHFATRGYLSQSEAYTTGIRLRQKINEGKEVVIFHLGDHDPSGLDMSRDLQERMMMFARSEEIDFRRLALNWDQVQEYGPPPNPAKETDSRFADYEQQYGDESWELDALDTRVIQALVRDNVNSLIDQPSWDAALAHEVRERQVLKELVNHWDGVKRLLERKIK